jgi:integrase
VRALLRSVASPQLAMLVLLMLTSGARPGEALAASWTDLDLSAGTWRIFRSLGRVDGPDGSGPSRLAFKPTRTPGSEATVRLPDITVLALTERRRTQLETRLAAPAWADPDLVFATALGTPLEPRNVLREFKAAAAAAGITRSVRLHDLRHAAASGLLAKVSTTASLREGWA